MWGDVLGSAIGLFDGRMGPSSTNFGSFSHSVWRGEWYVESPTTWVETSSKVRQVDIEFVAGSAWSERPPGEGLDIDLQRQWDETVATFTRPRADRLRSSGRRRHCTAASRDGVQNAE